MRRNAKKFYNKTKTTSAGTNPAEVSLGVKCPVFKGFAIT